MTHNGADHASAGAESELSALLERMDAIKKEVAAEVEKAWVTPYRTPEVFDLKVNARLAAHKEYRDLQQRVREAGSGTAGRAQPGQGGQD